jgi:hypothetical protein
MTFGNGDNGVDHSTVLLTRVYETDLLGSPYPRTTCRNCIVEAFLQHIANANASKVSYSPKIQGQFFTSMQKGITTTIIAYHIDYQHTAFRRCAAFNITRSKSSREEKFGIADPNSV